MEAAGFVDIVEQQFQWPFNTWPKREIFQDVMALVQLGYERGSVSDGYGYLYKSIEHVT